MADPRHDLSRIKAALQSGHAGDARTALQALVRGDAKNLEAWFLLGIAHIRCGSHAEAIPILQRVAQAAPQVPDVHNNLGVALRHAGRQAEAEQSFRQALTKNANYAEAHLNLGQLLLASGRAESSATHFLRAFQLAPAFAEALLGLGDALRELQRFSEARQAYEGYTQAHPTDANGWNSLGVVEQALANLPAAEAALRKCLTLAPAHASAASNLGAVLLLQGRLIEARAVAEASAKANPHSADAANNLALVQLRTNDFVAAEVELQRALTLDRSHKDARHNLANALHGLGRTAEAITELEKLLAEHPGFTSARFNLANMRLLTGDFARGWQDYEARPTRHLRAGLPADWDGQEALADKTLLVHAEQGLGDTLHFARYVPLLAARAKAVVFEVQSSLLPVLEPLNACAILVAKGEPRPAADRSLPLLSAPLLLGTLVDSIPPTGNWVGVSNERIQAWKVRLGGGQQPKVGLVWAGNPQHTNDHNRSLPLARLLAAIPGKRRLFSLQKDVPASDAALLAATPAVTHLGPSLTDFAETAALLKNLDVLVTVDTSVAHLAGALGVPTWILLPTPPDWRWLAGRDNSPWYPSIRLFRQQRPGDWSVPLAALHRELGALSNG